MPRSPVECQRYRRSKLDAARIVLVDSVPVLFVLAVGLVILPLVRTTVNDRWGLVDWSSVNPPSIQPTNAPAILVLHKLWRTTLIYRGTLKLEHWGWDFLVEVHGLRFVKRFLRCVASRWRQEALCLGCSERWLRRAAYGRKGALGEVHVISVPVVMVLNLAYDISSQFFMTHSQR